MTEGKGGSLLERMDLPEGGVDPTNLLPLQLKGLEPTSEAVLKQKGAPEPTEIRRIKKSATRSVIGIGIAMAALFAIGMVVVVWMLRPEQAAPPTAGQNQQAAAPVPPPPVQAGPVKPEQAPAPAAQKPEPAVAQPASPAADAPVPPPAPPAPAVAKAPPQPEAPAREAVPGAPPARLQKAKARPEQPADEARAKKRQRLAAVESTPPEPVERPRKSGGDPLLDVGGDDDLEKELSGRPKRSVYVPPAIGSSLPESVSVSQINEAVVGQKAALMHCIEKQKAADPNTSGTLRLRWIITGDGGVRDVHVVSGEHSRQPIASCISGVVRGLRFPRSQTRGQDVVFPFRF
jgi:hypothetical protein